MTPAQFRVLMAMKPKETYTKQRGPCGSVYQQTLAALAGFGLVWVIKDDGSFSYGLTEAGVKAQFWRKAR